MKTKITSVLVMVCAALTISIYLGNDPSPIRKFNSEKGCIVLTIDDLRIISPGDYCLDSDITITGIEDGISIEASDVLLDFQGHKISQAATVDPDNTEAIGVIIRSGSENVTIRDGSLRGFYWGIEAKVGVSHLTLSEMEIHHSNVGAVSLLDSTDVLVEDCLIRDIGRSIGRSHSGAYAIGVQVGGSRITIRNNDFLRINRQNVNEQIVGEGVAILVNDSAKVLVEKNKITNAENSVDGTIGIWLGTDSSTEISHNEFVDVERALVGLPRGSSIYENNIELSRVRPEGKNCCYGIYLDLVDGADPILVVDNRIVNYSQPLIVINDYSVDSILERNQCQQPKQADCPLRLER